MLTNLMFRKIGRILRSGSSFSPDYRAYKSYLLNNPGGNTASYFNLAVDFELAWSRARRGNGVTSIKESLERSRRVRENLPALIFLSEKYNIPITFAVVGHVALESCAEHRLPPKFFPAWAGENWYAIDPRTNIAADRNYYGSDLVKKIKSSRAGHEIASHSFSHVDFSDGETTPEAAKFEAEESYRVLKKIDPDLATYVFVKNRPGFFEFVKEAGFMIYRDNENHAIRENSNGLVAFPLGLWLSPKSHSPGDLLRLLEIAAKKKHLINFWLHLYEFSSADELSGYLEPVFSRIDVCQSAGTMKALTMRDIVRVS